MWENIFGNIMIRTHGCYSVYRFVMLANIVPEFFPFSRKTSNCCFKILFLLYLLKIFYVYSFSCNIWVKLEINTRVKKIITIFREKNLFHTKTQHATIWDNHIKINTVGSNHIAIFWTTTYFFAYGLIILGNASIHL